MRRKGLSFPFKPIAGASRAATVREYLRDGHPVVVVFRLPLGYPSSFLNDEHEWLDPETPPPSDSSHCVLITGFDDLRGSRVPGAVRVFDSHGESAFDGGGWWMGYRVLDSSAVQQAFAFT
jgi:hypothetical protein